LHFNPDMSDDELKLKMGELEEEQKVEAPVEAPVPVEQQRPQTLLDLISA